jgi:hypothetical protein
MNYRNLMQHGPLAIACLAVTAFVMGYKPSAEQERKAPDQARLSPSLRSCP